MGRAAVTPQTIACEKCGLVAVHNILAPISSTTVNAKEHDAGEWAELFRNANPMSKLLGIKSPIGSILSIMEARWEGETSFPLVATGPIG